MQIRSISFSKFHYINQPVSKKDIVIREYPANSVYLPGYNQTDGRLMVFCGRKPKTPLDNYIGGYKREKEFINSILIEPLNKKEQLPPSLLLAFPDSYTKKSVMQGIVKSSNARFIEIPSNDEKLCDNIRSLVKKSKEKFHNGGTQTVIVINDAEKVIGMTPAYAKELSIVPLSEEDFNNLKSGENKLSKVNYFKSLLDTVNKTSLFDNNTKSPITILFITQKPQYIHPDLITRDGKMKTVIFPIPNGKNVQDSIKFETEKIKNNISKIITKKGFLSERQLKKINADKKLKNLPIDIKSFPFQKIVKFAEPNKNNGAFSNEKYKDIAIKSLKDYVFQPKTPYSIHFIFNLASAKRDISAEEYQKYESMRCIFNKNL